MNATANLKTAMDSFRRMRATYAAHEQCLFEELYPVGALVEFLDGATWKGPAVVVKNRIGPITATHSPSVIVNVVGSGEEIVVRHPEYVRLFAGLQ